MWNVVWISRTVDAARKGEKIRPDLKENKRAKDIYTTTSTLLFFTYVPFLSTLQSHVSTPVRQTDPVDAAPQLRVSFKNAVTLYSTSVLMHAVPSS